MRIVFMGTPAFAVPSLSALVEAGHEVSLVLTRPDAVRGRGRSLTPSPVKERALELGIPVLEASRVTDDVFSRLVGAAPELVVVAAYGCLLPERVLELPRLGCVNVHASLLPRWRGAAPVQRAILAGDERTGVSIMRLVKKMDAGAWCLQASCEVGEKNAAQLTAELAELGASALVEALPQIADGSAVWVEQDESHVTLAPKVTKAEMALSPERAAEELARVVRASSDTAPARCAVCGKGVRVLAVRMASVQVGEGVVGLGRRGVTLGCREGALELLEVKPDGKRAMSATSWAAGLRGGDLTWGRC